MIAKKLLSKLLMSVLLGGFCTISDYIYNFAQPHSNHLMAALLDSSIHFTIGSWCWAVVCDSDFFSSIPEVTICGILSSAIDVDHFVTAQSWSLKKALSLGHRPFFHAVIAIPCLAGFCFLFQVLVLQICLFPSTTRRWHAVLLNLHIIVCVAWTSHQLRDSVRRGLWLWPFSSLPPTPYWIYVCVIVSFPLCLHCFVRKGHLLATTTSVVQCFPKELKSTNHVYSQIKQ